MKRQVLASFFVFATLAGSLEAACRQALAFGLDVSGSVDLREYRLQMTGLINALNDPDIVGILLDAPSAPVSIIIYEWSGPEDQAILVPWTVIDSRDALNSVSNQLALTHRRVSATGTALGLAMTFGASLLDQKNDCWKRTLDISGDGRNNNGPRPRDVRTDIGARGITINALVIGADAPGLADRRQADISELSSYFRAEVIVGPDSFVQTALGFEDYAASMVAKLKKELDGLNLSELRPVARPVINQ